MQLTEDQERVINQVVNAFETGSATGNYGEVDTYRDGPGDRLQVTYGRSGATEYGNLRELVALYVNEKATYSQDLQPYVSQIGRIPLAANDRFKALLHRAGSDPAMRTVQDLIFRKNYFLPAKIWAEQHDFYLPLSMLVIYDSYIHSGQVRSDIRKLFSEVPPHEGGNEKAWVEQYCRARRSWLSNHSRIILHATVYRMDLMLHEIARDNWDLSQRPIIVNHDIPVREISEPTIIE